VEISKEWSSEFKGGANGNYDESPRQSRRKIGDGRLNNLIMAAESASVFRTVSAAIIR
jgi:hypothetical protein